MAARKVSAVAMYATVLVVFLSSSFVSADYAIGVPGAVSGLTLWQNVLSGLSSVGGDEANFTLQTTDTSTDLLAVDTFNLNIPAGSTVTNIELQLLVQGHQTSATPLGCASRLLAAARVDAPFSLSSHVRHAHLSAQRG